MGFTRYLHKDCNFLLTVISGTLDKTTIHENIRDFNKQVKGIPNLKELVDCRYINNLKDLTVEEVVNTSKIEEQRLDSLLAILVLESDPLAYGMARSYSAFAEMKRKDVEVFTDHYQALAWLAKDGQELATLQYYTTINATPYLQTDSQFPQDIIDPIEP